MEKILNGILKFHREYLISDLPEEKGKFEAVKNETISHYKEVYGLKYGKERMIF